MIFRWRLGFLLVFAFSAQSVDLHSNHHPLHHFVEQSTINIVLCRFVGDLILFYAGTCSQLVYLFMIGAQKIAFLVFKRVMNCALWIEVHQIQAFSIGYRRS